MKLKNQMKLVLIALATTFAASFAQANCPGILFKPDNSTVPFQPVYWFQDPTGVNFSAVDEFVKCEGGYGGSNKATCRSILTNATDMATQSDMNGNFSIQFRVDGNGEPLGRVVAWTETTSLGNGGGTVVTFAWEEVVGQCNADYPLPLELKPNEQ